ncbi:uncharacterized protein O3C94_012283 isoform 1-T2 [Discoglossus pictus]
MSRPQNVPDVHLVTIQQMYWLTDTIEETLLQIGAICTDKVLEHVNYYDTEMYDLAINEMWLSKTGRDWQLIVDRSRREKTLEMNHLKIKENQKHSYQGASKTDEKDKTEPDGASRHASTCFELVSEREIIDYLSRVLHTGVDVKDVPMEDFLQLAGIQHYASFDIARRVTYKLRDGYTIVITLAETNLKKAAEISLEVDIGNVTRGFQRIEDLANELKLPPASK